jgi:hypothetical protein
MLLCTTEAEKNDADEKRRENPESNPPASSKQQKKEKQYQWLHGCEWCIFTFAIKYVYLSNTTNEKCTKTTLA